MNIPRNKYTNGWICSVAINYNGYNVDFQN